MDVSAKKQDVLNFIASALPMEKYVQKNVHVSIVAMGQTTKNKLIMQDP